MYTENKDLPTLIGELNVRIVPLQSHDSEGEKSFILTDAHSGEVVEDDRTEKVISMLYNNGLHFQEQSGRIIIQGESERLIFQQIVDTHEYRYNEVFGSASIASYSHSFKVDSAGESGALYESLVLGGKWQKGKSAKAASLNLDLRDLNVPIGELVHSLNEVDARFCTSHVNHTNFIHVLDEKSINGILSARDRIIKRIGFEHPEIQTMQKRIRELIMLAQSVHIGAEVKSPKLIYDEDQTSGDSA